jgi:hypothetical protein
VNGNSSLTFDCTDDGLSGVGGLQTDHSRIDIEVIALNDRVVIGTCNDIIQYIERVSQTTQAEYALVKPQRGLIDALPEECSLRQGWNCTFAPARCIKSSVRMHAPYSDTSTILLGNNIQGHSSLRAKSSASAASKSNMCKDANNKTYICMNEDEYTTGLELLVYDPDRHNMQAQEHYYFISVLVSSGTVTLGAKNLTILAENLNASIHNGTAAQDPSIGRIDSRLSDGQVDTLDVPSIAKNMSVSMKAEATGALVKFFGSLTDVNKALQAMRYHPSANFAGADTLQAFVHDLDCCSSSASSLQSMDTFGASIGSKRRSNLDDNGTSFRPSLFESGSMVLPISIAPVADPLQVRSLFASTKEEMMSSEHELYMQSCETALPQIIRHS